MRKSFQIHWLIFLSIILPLSYTLAQESNKPYDFKAVAFYTGQNDLAHISFVKEAKEWFKNKSEEYNFFFESTNDWKNLNTEFLSECDIVIFLDTRPEAPEQRAAFENYMKNGGAWIGFHFSAFALTPSAYNQDWDWYNNEFLGAGEYKGNTWKPTSAVLAIEDTSHPLCKGIPQLFTSAPNEWYSWENDLRANSNIKILASIHSSSFPLGTGPKQYEIWHAGYYPVVWTNTNYRMLYVNMGHNDIDYENDNKERSFTFQNKVQNWLITNALLWLGNSFK